MSFMFILELIAVIWLISKLCPSMERNPTQEEISNANRNEILENADIESRKIRYENKSFATRIQEVVGRCFDEFKIIDNLIMEDEDGIEHQIPILCATPYGVILFQTADYPGKGLFGNVSDEYWQIAQSADVAQNVPNTAILAINNAAMIKRITGIDIKPIAVISKYTPSQPSISTDVYGDRVILEDKLERELKRFVRFGHQCYPSEYLTLVKEKLLSINISDEDDEEEDIPEDVESDDSEDAGVPATA